MHDIETEACTVFSFTLRDTILVELFSMEDSSVIPVPDSAQLNSAIPAEIEEVTPELPVDIQADFSPVTQHQVEERKANQTIEPSQYESFRAQDAFDRAVLAAEEGHEELAVENYLKASNLAESAREWYIAAVE